MASTVTGLRVKGFRLVLFRLQSFGSTAQSFGLSRVVVLQDMYSKAQTTAFLEVSGGVQKTSAPLNPKPFLEVSGGVQKTSDCINDEICKIWKVRPDPTR